MRCAARACNGFDGLALVALDIVYVDVAKLLQSILFLLINKRQFVRIEKQGGIIALTA